ncbi:30S ribosomal protein S6 [bacterium BMS3Abin15]|nr:30S ribosomal protein S6 [bacterium BMS3Abin15]HDZ85812.1 hypothetical protein [Candidatus Moranbacteria bacterium]
MEYELLYLIGESNKPKLDKITEELQKIITGEGGKLLESKIIKERKMSYKIENEIRGIYIAQRFNVVEKDSENHNPDTATNIAKKLNLNPDILRLIIVNAKELPELKSEEEEKKIIKPVTAKKKTEIKIEKAKKEEVPKEDKKETDEDIDKKLEEILKI